MVFTKVNTGKCFLNLTTKNYKVVKTEINKHIKLLIVIPCYNEEESIGNLLQSLQSLSLPNVSITALPVNDCSKDNTLSVIRKHTSTYLNLPVNLGIGGAVQSGYKYAYKNKFDIAIQLDGDGQHPINEIQNLIQPILNNEADVVIGSRFITKQGFQSSTLRRTGIKYFKNLNRLLLGITITDSTSGFRALNIKALEIVNDYYPDEYPEPEAIVLYHLNNLKIKEIPVVMHERQGGQSSIRSFGSIYYMMKVTLGILFIYLRLKLNGKRHTL
ncbi:MAG: glycosyltransferase family 2 protein [Bacteroidia bacterium]|nr:glycosyltransferase family 2 protein [Bacteroidia bacterium]